MRDLLLLSDHSEGESELVFGHVVKDVFCFQKVQRNGLNLPLGKLGVFLELMLLRVFWAL